jgi:hypothetical protein
VAATIMPPKLAARLPADLLWRMGLVLIFAALMHEKRGLMGSPKVSGPVFPGRSHGLDDID